MRKKLGLHLKFSYLCTVNENDGISAEGTENYRSGQAENFLAKQKIFPGQAAKMRSYRRHETINLCLTKKFTNYGT